jgi:hypothetical protein
MNLERVLHYPWTMSSIQLMVERSCLKDRLFGKEWAFALESLLLGFTDCDHPWVGRGSMWSSFFRLSRL